MLHDLAARLTLPGLPEWSGLAALCVLLLLAGCLLLMPFSVFGVKGRLDAIEAQLDEMRAEMRAMLARQADARPSRDWAPAVQEEDYVPPTTRADPPPLPRTQPPLPPTGRAEPRISWQRR